MLEAKIYSFLSNWFFLNLLFRAFGRGGCCNDDLDSYDEKYTQNFNSNYQQNHEQNVEENKPVENVPHESDPILPKNPSSGYSSQSSIASHDGFIWFNCTL